MAIWDGKVLFIQHQCLGALMLNKKCFGAQRDISDLSVEDANYGVLDQALYILYEFTGYFVNGN